MTIPFPPRGGFMLSLAAVAALLAAAPARADVLELVNGDHYNGTVIALTRTNLEFQSEIQGVVKIPRNKIARITLREPAAPKTTARTATNAPAFDVVSSTNSVAAPGSTGQAAQVIQQMRSQGVDPNLMNQIQQQMLGQSSPEATRMFNDMVGGLMSGAVSMDDVRNQAQGAIKDIQAAKKDLGGDADTTELLDGYLAILQKFVRETDAPATKAPVSQSRASQPPPAAPAD